MKNKIQDEDCEFGVRGRNHRSRRDRLIDEQNELKRRRNYNSRDFGKWNKPKRGNSLKGN